MVEGVFREVEIKFPAVCKLLLLRKVGLFSDGAEKRASNI